MDQLIFMVLALTVLFGSIGIFARMLHQEEAKKLRARNGIVRFPLEIGDKLHTFNGHITILEINDAGYSVLYYEAEANYPPIDIAWGIGMPYSSPEIEEVRILSEDEIKYMILYSEHLYTK